MLSFLCTGYIASDNQREWAVASALPKLVDARDRAVEERLWACARRCADAARHWDADSDAAPPEGYDPRAEYARLEATLKHVDDFIVNNGPFDGLLGFSQGAALACSLANLSTKGDFPHRFGFVVIDAARLTRLLSAAVCSSVVASSPEEPQHFVSIDSG